MKIKYSIFIVDIATNLIICVTQLDIVIYLVTHVFAYSFETSFGTKII